MINVTKRDGTLEPLNLDKIHQILFFACDGLSGVSVSEIEIRSQLQFHEGISTKTIHEILIKASASLIDKDTPNYQYVTGRLINYALRKEVYGQYEPIPFLEHINKMVNLELYDKIILEKYSTDELLELGKYIKHKRDDKFTYAAMTQWQGKYLVQNRTTKQIYETPQMAYMMIAATLFISYPSETRISYVKKMYNAISNFDISLPTPIMGGVRTCTRQFSSCVVLNSGDSLDSIGASSEAILRYISRRAGLGINAGRIRAVGSPIRNGEASHTGLIPFLNLFRAAVKSCSQGGLRGGAATVHFPIWHYEFKDLVVLKNNKGTEFNRIRNMDYCFQINGLMYQRLVDGKEITFFSPSDVPGLYDAFCSNQDEFKKLYEQYESDTSIRQYKMSALEVFSQLMNERSETGKIYIQNIDHANTHSTFVEDVAPIEQSNLCVSPDTLVLTDTGYIKIGEHEDNFVNVWNGKEFSTVQIKKTGTNQQLLRVVTDSGFELECTPYHKFYVVVGRSTIVEKRAYELKPNDKLIRLKTPLIEGQKELEYPYENGFYSGDGCKLKNGKKRIYLYGDKIKLKEYFSVSGHWSSEHNNRLYIETNLLEDKFFVPDASYTVESRLRFLEGITDSDGCVYRNGKNQELVITSINKDFLKEIQLMLQTLGVSSKIKTQMKSGKYKLPDGNGDYDYYECKEAYRLIISSNGVLTLGNIGYSPKRLKLVTHIPNRNCSRFVKVKDIVYENKLSDTYCFNEPKEHKGVFNGILTGQCQEIALPSKPFEDVNSGDGLISLCTLAAINWGNFNTPEEMEESCDLAVRALDALLDFQDYPVIHALRSTELYRPLGVGIINMAYFLAKRGLHYDESALDIVNEWSEAWSYYLIKSSVQLAKEQGKCKGFDDLKYAKGILPIDTYKKSVDELVAPKLKMDWELLRSEIKEHGIRNSTVMALMPAETSAQISNSTNGIEPVRSLVTIKVSKDGVLPQVVPEIHKLKNKYDILWDLESMDGYIKICAVLQKYIDQSISANTSYNPEHHENNKIPMSLLLTDILKAYKYGLKNLYYMNTYDGAKEVDLDQLLGTKEKEKKNIILPPMEDEGDCDSCKI